MFVGLFGELRTIGFLTLKKELAPKKVKDKLYKCDPLQGVRRASSLSSSFYSSSSSSPLSTQ